MQIHISSANDGVPNSTRAQQPKPKLAVWEIGFRPFFLFGAIQSIVALFVWLMFLHGRVALPTHFDAITWHAHEMLFGFAGAIIAGFLMTASQNWTGQRGVHGRRLQLVFFVWLTARLLAIASVPSWIFALVDVAFWPLLAFCLYPYLTRPGQERNRVFFVIFSLLALSNAALHAEGFGWISGWSRPALMTALWTIVVVTSLIGGRVIPFFTGRAVPEAKPVSRPWLEKAAHASTAALAISAVTAEFTIVTAVLGLVAFALHAARLAGWQSWKTVKVPILFILHIGYLFLPVGFALKGLAALGWVAPTLATHAITVGALGITIFAMITRVSLGHTGRPIRSSPMINVSYALIFLATCVRTFGPLIAPQQTATWIDLSGGLWITLYLIFVAQYARLLMEPRPDGKPG